MHNPEIIVVGSGIGGLVAGALLARYGRRVLVCESHSVAGGAAHEFRRQGFRFDSGPSFYCGLGDPDSLNPVQVVLSALGESLETIPYDPLGFYHLPEGTVPIYGDHQAYHQAIAQFSPQGAQEWTDFVQRLQSLYEGLQAIPLLRLRSDWRLFPDLVRHHPRALLRLMPQLRLIQGSTGQVMDQTVQDPWVRRLIDLECFLLSGMKAHETVAPEMAFMFGERQKSQVDYPRGGSGALVDALIRGLTKWGGQLRTGAHVEQIWVEQGQARGVRLRSGEVIPASIVIANATLWDTVESLLQPADLPTAYRQQALQTPAVNSFMHLHLGFRAEVLDGLQVHHVVVHDNQQDITAPGNTCMISIPSVLDPALAPQGHHVLHAYTLEPWESWAAFKPPSNPAQSKAGTAADSPPGPLDLTMDQLSDDQRSDLYRQLKHQRAACLYRAVERIIPDIRDRTVLELIGSPLTHQRYLRRYQGTYGPAIAAGQGIFPGCQTPIRGLYRVGDSTRPGIGVPAVAASGILCANSLVSSSQIRELIDS